MSLFYIADVDVVDIVCCFLNVNSVGYQPCSMPPDHVIVLLEGLTTLCQYCLLDGSAQQDVGVVGQMSPLTRTGSNTDSGLLSNLANVFHFGSQRVILCPFIIYYAIVCGIASLSIKQCINIDV